MVTQKRTSDEWARVEADEHDAHYKDQYPFGLTTYEFTEERALWYEDYAFKKGRRRDRGHRTKKVLELIDLDTLNEKRLLDVGCGIGKYSVLFAKKGASVTGIDLSPVGIEMARQIAAANGVTGRCHFIAGDFSRQTFDEEEFDVVLLHEVYHHLIKYPGVKEKISRLTRKNGTIILADTMRGAGPIHMGRRIVKYLRYRGRPEIRRHEEGLGDVLLTLKDYEDFARGFRHHDVYTMSFLYMIKQTNLQHHVDSFWVRLLLRVTKYADDALLWVFPWLRRLCGEAILYIEK